MLIRVLELAFEARGVTAEVLASGRLDLALGIISNPSHLGNALEIIQAEIKHQQLAPLLTLTYFDPRELVLRVVYPQAARVKFWELVSIKDELLRNFAAIRAHIDGIDALIAAAPRTSPPVA